MLQLSKPCFSKIIARVGVSILVFLLYAIPRAAGQQADSSEHEAVVTWSADCQGKNEAPAVHTQASAKAEFHFDFDRSVATFTINSQTLHDVSKVLLRVERAPGELKGPALVTLYDAGKDGPFPGTYTKEFSGSVFKEMADIVLDGEGSVEVLTKDHPNGEIIGLVEMHKSYK